MKHRPCGRREWEVRGQVPGTTRNGGRTKSAINNSQASGYVRAPEGVAQCLGLPRHRTEAQKYPTEVPRYRSTAPVADATWATRLHEALHSCMQLMQKGVINIAASRLRHRKQLLLNCCSDTTFVLRRSVGHLCSHAESVFVALCLLISVWHNITSQWLFSVWMSAYVLALYSPSQTCHCSAVRRWQC